MQELVSSVPDSMSVRDANISTKARPESGTAPQKHLVGPAKYLQALQEAR